MSALAAYGCGVIGDDMAADKTILALDPGGVTGWFLATIEADTGLVGTPNFGQLELRNTNGELLPHGDPLLVLLDDVVSQHEYLMVVAENYRPEFARAQDYAAMEYLGLVEGWCRRRLVSFERQDRGIKTFWTKEKLQKVNAWPKAMPHAQDAARHWLAYAFKQDERVKNSFLRALRG
jgi:hypothetical protein